MSKKTNYDNRFKAKVAIEALRGNRTLVELASEYDIATSLVSKWKSELEANAGTAFGVKSQKSPEDAEQKLYQQIGKLTMEVDYLKKFVGKYR